MLIRVSLERTSRRTGVAKRAVKSCAMTLPEGVSGAAVPGKASSSTSASKRAHPLPSIFLHTGTIIRFPDSMHHWTRA